jgi:hypothetical protein
MQYGVDVASLAIETCLLPLLFFIQVFRSSWYEALLMINIAARHRHTITAGVND